MTSDARLSSVQELLGDAGQEHLLRFYRDLDGPAQGELLSQIEGVDWPEVGRLIQSHVKREPQLHLPEGIEPAVYYPYQPTPELQEKYRRARELGETLIRDGRVAAFTVAGGQGTRLGWDAPKGTFPATPIRGLSLFGCMAEYLHKLRDKYGVVVPWYIMTSPINDAPTRGFFDQEDYFGLNPEDVMLFPQAMMPAIDIETGKALLADPGTLALSPNGHGGSLKALHTGGGLADMQRRGVEQISYVQVDNPIVKVVDPLFLGLHAMDDAQMSSKMLPKREPMEKLGNFCLVEGRVTVIEYSDLPESLAREMVQEGPRKGQLRFLAGSIAIHLMRRDFVESLNTLAEGFALPFHRANKKVPYLDVQTGEAVEPMGVNAVKLETFVFDALPMCERSVVYETSREEEFAPIKNADEPGRVVPDSPASSKAIQVARAGRWLAAAGVDLPMGAGGQPDATLEVKQSTAIEAADLKGAGMRGVDLPERVERGGELLV